MEEKLIALKVTEDDLHTLNNILGNCKNDIMYEMNDILAVLNKVKRTAKINNIELAEWAEDENPDNFEVFVDRASSLIKRWRKFKDKHPEKKDVDKHCIYGFLFEITDAFSESLCGKNLSLDKEQSVLAKNIAEIMDQTGVSYEEALQAVFDYFGKDNVIRNMIQQSNRSLEDILSQMIQEDEETVPSDMIRDTWRAIPARRTE